MSKGKIQNHIIHFYLLASVAQLKRKCKHFLQLKGKINFTNKKEVMNLIMKNVLESLCIVKDHTISLVFFKSINHVF